MAYFCYGSWRQTQKRKKETEEKVTRDAIYNFLAEPVEEGDVIFYFVFSLRRAAQRFFMRSDSFLRPAAVKRLPPRSGAALTLAVALAMLAALFIAAYLRFMASEIFLLAAALILRFFLG